MRRVPEHGPISPTDVVVEVANDQPLPDEIGRITAGLYDRILRELTDPVDGIDEGVHTARKAMKRIRALLRLVVDQTEHKQRNRENRVLRDCGRAISPVRDTLVLLLTLDSVSSTIDPLALRSIRGTLQANHVVTTRQTFDGDVVAKVTSAIEASRTRVTTNGPFISVEGASTISGDFSAVAEGLANIHRRGRRLWKRAGRETTDHRLHAWRKPVKYLRYQLESLRELDPGYLGPTIDRLTELGEDLGVDHDLAILNGVLRSDVALDLDVGIQAILLERIDERRAGLQSRALDAGESFFGEPTDVFLARMGERWDAAR